jgi:hypothetical protein
VAKSYRTQKESALAARRIERDSQGQPVLPRIVQRKPRPGDIHPLDKRVLRWFLERQPVDIYYGLRAIELRAREGAVGEPYALYRRQSKEILVYSIPPVWTFSHLSEGHRNRLEGFQAVVQDQDGEVVVSWPDEDYLTLWFLFDVVAHELGHHSGNQFAHKNGPRGRTKDEEARADLAAARALHAELARVRRRRE